VILSNEAILEALADGRLQIEPPPIDTATSAVDLTLGPLLQIPRSGLSIAIDFGRGSVADTLTAISESVDLRSASPFRLERGQFVLGQTEEVVSFPLRPDTPESARHRPCLAGRVEGKSSRARFGLLVHFTAPTIHAGWSGRITLEMMNLGPAPLILEAGMRICQLVVEEVVGVPLADPSSFQGQRTPAGQP
jgi:dCTP deaminase